MPTHTRKRLPPIHPGDLLKDLLTEAGPTVNAFFIAPRIPVNRIGAIPSPNGSPPPFRGVISALSPRSPPHNRAGRAAARATNREHEFVRKGAHAGSHVDWPPTFDISDIRA